MLNEKNRLQNSCDKIYLSLNDVKRKSIKVIELVKDVKYIYNVKKRLVWVFLNRGDTQQRQGNRLGRRKD